jgi:hypothetical protein
VEDPHHILLKWRFDAALNIPGKPRFKPYTGTTLYSTNDKGLIYKHEEVCDQELINNNSIMYTRFQSAD